MDETKSLIILELSITRSSVVNDFLNYTGLNKNFALVIASVEYFGPDNIYDYDYTSSNEIIDGVVKRGGPELKTRVKSRLALKALDEETSFYWQLRGHDRMRAAIDEFIASRPYNKGVS